MTKLAIIFGGKSVEHELSLKSAVSVLSAIDRSKYSITMIGITKEGKWLLYDGPVEMIGNGEWRDYAELKLLAEPEKYELKILTSLESMKDYADVVFPVLHGPGGENGVIQGLIESVGLPYVGCRVLGAALTMDKEFTKAMMRQSGFLVCDWEVYFREELQDNSASVVKDIEEHFSYPLFVKPAGCGASMGVSKVFDRNGLIDAMKKAGSFDRKIMVESFVDGRELCVGVIGNMVPLSSAAGEVLLSGEYFDEISKKTAGTAVNYEIPAAIPADIMSKAKMLAEKAYRILDLRGFARVDFFLEKNSNELYINEINAIPMFSEKSIFTGLWHNAGLEYSELLDRMIGYALEKE